MAAAAAFAKVLRGGRSGLSLGMLPAVGRRVPQEGMLLGSSAAAPAAGMGRLMHTGRNPVLSQGAGVKVPVKMEQFCSKRFLRWERSLKPDHPGSAFAFISAAFVCSLVSLAFTIPTIYRSAKGLYKLCNDESCRDDYCP